MKNKISSKSNIGTSYFINSTYHNGKKLKKIVDQFFQIVPLYNVDEVYGEMSHWDGGMMDKVLGACPPTHPICTSINIYHIQHRVLIIFHFLAKKCKEEGRSQTWVKPKPKAFPKQNDGN